MRKSLIFSMIVVVGLAAGTSFVEQPAKADPPVNPPVTCVSLRQLIDECNAEIASLEQQIAECEQNNGDCTILRLRLDAERIIRDDAEQQAIELGCWWTVG